MARSYKDFLNGRRPQQSVSPYINYATAAMGAPFDPMAGAMPGTYTMPAPVMPPPLPWSPTATMRPPAPDIVNQRLQDLQATQAGILASKEATAAPNTSFGNVIVGGFDAVGNALNAATDAATYGAAKLTQGDQWLTDKSQGAIAFTMVQTAKKMRAVGTPDSVIFEAMNLPFGIVIPVDAFKDKTGFIDGLINAYDNGYTAYKTVSPGGPMMGESQVPVAQWGPGSKAAHEWLAGESPWYQRAFNDMAESPSNIALGPLRTGGKVITKLGEELVVKGAAEGGAKGAVKVAAGRTGQVVGTIAKIPDVVLNQAADKIIEVPLKAAISGAAKIPVVGRAIEHLAATPDRIRAHMARENASEGLRARDRIVTGSMETGLGGPIVPPGSVVPPTDIPPSGPIIPPTIVDTPGAPGGQVDLPAEVIPPATTTYYPQKSPARIAGIVDGTVNTFDPTTDGPRLVDRAYRSPKWGEYDALTKDKRTQWWAQDRAIESQIGRLDRQIKDFKAERNAADPGTAARKIAHDAQDAIFKGPRYKLKFDQKINAAQHTIDTYPDFVNVYGESPDIPYTTKRKTIANPDGTTENAPFTQESTEWLIERAVYGSDDGAVRILKLRTDPGTYYKNRITTDQLDRIKAAQQSFRATKAGVESPASIPTMVQRYEEVGVQSGGTEKPQGLYTSPVGITSPHADLGGNRITKETNPSANVLSVETKWARTNRGNVPESAGVAALRLLVGEKQASTLLSMNRRDLSEFVSSEFPSVDFSGYTDAQEIAEAYAGLVARNKGYDAIWGVDASAPEFNEYVGLTNNAFRATKAGDTVATGVVTPSASTFTTEKGSTYQVTSKGTTIRDKAARPEHGADSGLKPESEATFYVTSDDAIKLGYVQSTSTHKKSIAMVDSSHAGIRWDSGPDAGKFERSTVVPVESSPRVGLTPVETWNGGAESHFGNRIVSVGDEANPNSIALDTTSQSDPVISVRDQWIADGRVSGGVRPEQIRIKYAASTSSKGMRFLEGGVQTDGTALSFGSNKNYGIHQISEGNIHTLTTFKADNAKEARAIYAQFNRDLRDMLGVPQDAPLPNFGLANDPNVSDFSASYDQYLAKHQITAPASSAPTVTPPPTPLLSPAPVPPSVAIPPTTLGAPPTPPPIPPSIGGQAPLPIPPSAAIPPITPPTPPPMGGQVPPPVPPAPAMPNVVLPPDIHDIVNVQTFTGASEPLYKGKTLLQVRDAIETTEIVPAQQRAQQLIEEIRADKVALGLDAETSLLVKGKRRRPVVEAPVSGPVLGNTRPLKPISSTGTIAKEQELADLMARYAGSGDILTDDARAIATEAASAAKEMDIYPELHKRPPLVLDLLDSLFFRVQRHLLIADPFTSYGYSGRNVMGNEITAILGDGVDVRRTFDAFHSAFQKTPTLAMRTSEDLGMVQPSWLRKNAPTGFEAGSSGDVITGKSPGIDMISGTTKAQGRDTPTRELAKKLHIDGLAKLVDKKRSFVDGNLEYGAKSAYYASILHGLAAEDMVKLADEITAYAARRAKQTGVTYGDTEVLDMLFALRKKDTGLFSYVDVHKGIKAQALAKGMDEAAAQRMADTASQQWMHSARQFQNAATASTNRIYPSQRRMTNLDAYMKYISIFHFWPTRTARLVTEEMIRNPQLYLAWQRAHDGLSRMAEEGNYPASVRMLMRIAESPYGFMLYANPASLFLVTALQPESPNYPDPEGMTKLGHYLKEFRDKTGIGLNPFVDGVMNMLGVYGNSFPPNPWPSRTTELAGAAIDYALIEMGHAPGTPIYDNAMAWVRSQGSGIIPGTSNVPMTDQGANTMDIVSSLILDNDPELAARIAGVGPDGKQTPDAIAAQRELGVIMENEDDPRYIAALKQAAGQSLFTKFVNGFSPFTIKAKVISREQTLDAAKAGRDVRDAGGTMSPWQQGAVNVRSAITQTPEYNKLDSLVSEYHTIGTERQQSIADDWTKIAFAEFDPSESAYIGGKRYSLSQVKAMSQETRYNLADQWVAEVKGTEERKAYQATQKVFVEAHPEMKGYDTYKKLITKSGLGQEAWIEDVRRGNQNYDTYLTEQKDKYGTEPIDAAFTPGAYFAWKGERKNIYDANPESVRDMSKVPYGSPDPSATSTGFGSSTKDTSVAGRAITLSEDIASYNADMAAVSQYLPKTISWEEMSPSVRAGYEDSLNRKGIKVPTMPAKVREYYKFVNTRKIGEDVSYEAYITWMDALMEKAAA